MTRTYQIAERERALQPAQATCLENSINGRVSYDLISHLAPSLKRFGVFDFDGEVAHIRDKKVNVLGGTTVREKGERLEPRVFQL